MKLSEWVKDVEARLAALEGKKPAPKKKAPAKKTKKK